MLAREVLGGTLAPGDPLPNEDLLAARFEVSRSSIREAVKTLAAKGLIEATAKVKLLANGEVGQKLEVHAHKVSGAARQKVESAGGTVVLIDAGTS